MMTNRQGRVAIFIPALYGGGAERTMLKLGGGIAARGYRVDLVLARARGAYLSEVPPEINVVDLKASRDLLSIFALMAYLRKMRPAVLLSGLHTNIIAILARRMAHTPTRLIVSERNAFSTRVESLSADFRMRLMPELIRHLYPFADCVVAVSRGVAADLVDQVGVPGKLVTVIYNPVITPDLKTRASESLDHPWFKSGEPPVILSAGRLVPQKDFATLISAFARVRDRSDARLLILGEGEQRQSLEAQVKSLGLDQDVCLPGFIGNPYPYMREAAAFVLSSRYEGLPGVLVEALFCGARLVATDCPGGSREILCDGNYGDLVPVGDARAMSKAICKALTQGSLAPSEQSWKRFELETIVDQYMELFFGEEMHREKLE